MKSTILTFVGAIGVIATSVMVAKATPKADKLVADAREKKGEELTKFEVVKAAAPAYIPAAVTGAATIGCIFGANVLNKRQQATLTSAYALLDSSYGAYREKVRDMCGEETDEKIKEEVAKDIYEEIEQAPVSDDKKLFMDFNTLRYFEASMDEVIQKATLEDGLECYIITMPY